ncbi:ribosome assembly RNA-binding protein YhbY [Endozoicomonas euniceicola]|uniref:Ribosome assembly RNA-binding protein YhbY n=2 Tax=Endozoicomonas euniceicola TaxID=1234143 RepID=A0ABY6H3N6_9GAMM|nr:ribosome assembly RNA-binding protein YhbY [Endozoicomonas euniceicola]UYM18838.1 ribosome assembly RNA-binding protein YhbY [Endozoicomonas euniceicola]
MMSLSTDRKKHFRSLGHKLKPVVMVAGKGMTDGVVEETLRALSDHELIKVKFAVGDREAKKTMIDALVKQTKCELVQTIGNIALIYKENKDAKPGLSNVKSF